jgi:hypothetical protein
VRSRCLNRKGTAARTRYMAKDDKVCDGVLNVVCLACIFRVRESVGRGRGARQSERVREGHGGEWGFIIANSSKI